MEEVRVGRRYVPNGAALVWGSERIASVSFGRTHPLFRWTKADGWETVGHESSRTEDTRGIGSDYPIRIHHPSLCIFADIRASCIARELR